MKKFREIPICTCQTPKNWAKSEKNQEKILKNLKKIKKYFFMTHTNPSHTQIQI